VERSAEKQEQQLLEDKRKRKKGRKYKSEGVKKCIFM
jgi:hypothetical protein